MSCIEQYDFDKNELRSEEIERIFSSDTLSEDDKIKRIKMLCELCRKSSQLDLDKIKLLLNEQLCKSLIANLGEVTTCSQRALLDLVEILAQIGTETPNQKNQNLFYDVFNSSGLINNVGNIICKVSQINITNNANNNKDDQNNQEVNEQPFQSLLAQLIRVYFYMNLNTDIETEILYPCAVSIANDTILLQRRLKAFNQNSNKDQNQESISNNNKELELNELIHPGTQSYQALSCVAHKNGFFIGSIDWLHIHISSLIHINCPDDLKCSKCIQLPDTHSVNDLQSAVLHAQWTVSYYNDSTKEYIHHEHNILPHVTPLLKKLTNNKSNNQSDRQVALEALNLVWSIFIDVQSCAQSAVAVPSFIPSLVTASIYRDQGYRMKRECKHADDIRIMSLLCIFHIIRVDAPSALKVLLNDGQYVNALIRSVGAAGGSGEENRNVKFQGLENMNIIVSQMHGEEYPYQALPVLLKGIQELLMEEGADEEFNACLFHTVDEILIQQDAYQVIKALLNSYQDDTNGNQQ